MIKRTLLLFFIAFFVVSYKTRKIVDQCDKHGKIVGFDATKCGCCWGWIIAVGKDTIKADKLPVTGNDYFGYIGNVKINIGKKLDRCTIDYPYYKIECIEKIK